MWQSGARSHCCSCSSWRLGMRYAWMLLLAVEEVRRMTAWLSSHLSTYTRVGGIDNAAMGNHEKRPDR